MTNHVATRTQLLRALREELVGPDPRGAEVKPVSGCIFEKYADAVMPRRQVITGEEILTLGSPSQRYGVGVLYAPENQTTLEPQNDEIMPEESEFLTSDQVDKLPTMPDHNGGNDSDDADFDLSTANTYRPTSMGLSFLARLPSGAKLIIELPRIHPATGLPVNAHYEPLEVHSGTSGYTHTWWLRQPLEGHKTILAERLCRSGIQHITESIEFSADPGPMKLTLEVLSRPHGDDPEQRLITVCLVNRSDAVSGIKEIDRRSLYQTYFQIKVQHPEDRARILQYPSPPVAALEPEAQGIALLYRNASTFATGHGCAADWTTTKTEMSGVTSISAECLPTTEVPGITPDIRRENGDAIQVSMKDLGELELGDSGFAALEEIIDQYEAWISMQHNRIVGLPLDLQSAAMRHMEDCTRCAKRMRNGLEYLRTNTLARQSFRLANHAILLQQVRNRLPIRSIGWDLTAKRMTFSEQYTPVGAEKPNLDRGHWRAFQIAFILMSIQSTGDLESSDRETVELIWFPTGGGKTEAYLGLAAFSMFLRRLSNPRDAGVSVLMRYTLRLLTAQQFQRAASLIAAMDHLRRKNKLALGEIPYSIAIWVGGTTTPNAREKALENLRNLEEGNKYTSNELLLTKCPWCGCQMGPLPYQHGKRKELEALKRNKIVPGYKRQSKTVVFHCPDPACDFHNMLPVYVIDEDIYDKRPSLVIGTVDKFAMLTWKPEARSLFGLDDMGNRNVSPPGLIIQDELHLIAGPLGSMVGLFEGLIEELCTDHRNQKAIRPKIVCSTATIRRYQEQIRALYARDQVMLFPPPGLDSQDSFFAREDTSPGRVYVGVHAPGLGSLQTVQVRSFSALLQMPLNLTPEEQDPWWTLLTFFNSLRELGGALSLFQSDILEHLNVIRRRKGEQHSRYLNHVLELTSRLSSEEVPKALEELSVEKTSADAKKTIDVCLASNIIEVGVDIDRLSLMAIVGQPKSTSQYIQVSGRVGRRRDRPGLVLILYSASKPRDRSHFERFRSYHQSLYAQVEPTSVTPFSPPAIERALHAVMVAHARQTIDSIAAERPIPVPSVQLEAFTRLILDRVLRVDPQEYENVKRVLERRIGQWTRSQPQRYSPPYKQQITDPPLIHAAGAYTPPDWINRTWSTPQSMRNVDSECLIQIWQPEVE
jgi:Helicase conserved C-terminal domain